MRNHLNIGNPGEVRALVLHPDHERLPMLVRQLRAIGIDVELIWPALPTSAISANFVFYDTDLGHDAQFPWAIGEAPMPMIALVGSEAPGRIEWASRTGADALLMKPLGAEGVFSALLMAKQSFEKRRALAAEVASLRQRLSARQTIVQAVNLLATKAKSQDAAYNQLRHLSMAWQVTMEDAAEQIVQRAKVSRDLHDCN